MPVVDALDCGSASAAVRRSHRSDRKPSAESRTRHEPGRPTPGTSAARLCATTSIGRHVGDVLRGAARPGARAGIASTRSTPGRCARSPAPARSCEPATSRKHGRAAIQSASTIALLAGVEPDELVDRHPASHRDTVYRLTDCRRSDQQQPPTTQGRALGRRRRRCGPLQARRVSLAIWYGRTRFRNGTNHAPIAHAGAGAWCVHRRQVLVRAAGTTAGSTAAPAIAPMQRQHGGHRCTQSSTCSRAWSETEATRRVAGLNSCDAATRAAIPTTLAAIETSNAR